MPKEFDACVADLKKQKYSSDSAYAICVAQYKKKHGKSPFSFKEEIKEASMDERRKRLEIAVLEAEKKGKKAKIIEEVTGQAVIDNGKTENKVSHAGDAESSN